MKKQQYSETNYKHVWDGDMSRIPRKGTLVGIDTASRGIVNAITAGYEITWRNDKPSIRVKVKHCDSGCENERMLQELDFPISIREKELMTQ